MQLLSLVKNEMLIFVTTGSPQLTTLIRSSGAV